jgi:hypothetical protein
VSGQSFHEQIQAESFASWIPAATAGRRADSLGVVLQLHWIHWVAIKFKIWSNSQFLLNRQERQDRKGESELSYWAAGFFLMNCDEQM